MTQSRRKPWWRSRISEGPLIAYLDSFERLLIKQGYAEDSIRKQTQLIADFNRWLKHKKVAAEDLTDEHAERFLRYRIRHLRRKKSDAPALRRLLQFLQKMEIIARKAAPIENTPAQQVLNEYALHLRRERGLATGTIAQYVWFVRRFLTGYFGDASVQLSRLDTRAVVSFLECEAARLQSPKRAQLLTNALRSFLRYVRYRAYIKVDLASAVPSVASWRMAAIPKAISDEDTRRVLTHCHRRSAVGRRDYAILLLLHIPADGGRGFQRNVNTDSV